MYLTPASKNENTCWFSFSLPVNPSPLRYSLAATRSQSPNRVVSFTRFVAMAEFKVFFISFGWTGFLCPVSSIVLAK